MKLCDLFVLRYCHWHSSHFPRYFLLRQLKYLWIRFDTTEKHFNNVSGTNHCPLNEIMAILSQINQACSLICIKRSMVENLNILNGCYKILASYIKYFSKYSFSKKYKPDQCLNKKKCYANGQAGNCTKKK